MIVHWADFNPDAEVSVVVAECGATGLVLPDASLVPPSFDFASSMKTVTCEACVRGKMAKVSEAGKRAGKRVKARAN